MKKKIIKKTKGLWSEFKAFISKGSVLDLATGVIVANAFSKIVNSFTSAIIMPVINWIFSLLGLHGSELVTILNKEPMYILDSDGIQTLNTACIYINWSAFIQAVIDFFIIALIIFLFVKIIRGLQKTLEDLNDKLHEKEEEEKRKLAEEQARKADEEAKAKAEEQAILDKEKAETATTNELLVEVINLLKK